MTFQRRKFRGCTGAENSRKNEKYFNDHPRVSIAFEDEDFEYILNFSKRENLPFGESVRKFVKFAKKWCVSEDTEIKNLNIINQDCRTENELSAYSDFLEACKDDCENVTANKDVQSAIIKIESQIKRLHVIEKVAINFALRMSQCDFTDPDCDFDDKGYWEDLALFHKTIQEMVPSAKMKTIYQNLKISKKGEVK